MLLFIIPTGLSAEKGVEKHTVRSDWVQTTLGNIAVNTLCIDAGGSLFAGTYGGGIFRSSDNGGSWEEKNNGLFNQTVFAIIAHPGQPGVLFAGTDGSGVFRSNDDGDSWLQLSGTTENHTILSLAINADYAIFAGTSMAGIFRSGNNGNQWLSVNNGLTANEIVFDLLTDRNGTIYAATNAHGVFHSVNNGANWLLTGLQGVDVRTLSSHASGGIFAGAWFDGMYYFEQGHPGWHSFGLPNRHIMDIMIDEQGNIYAATHGWGIARSADGGISWDDFNEGLSDAGVWSLAVNDSGYIFAGTSTSGVFRKMLPNTVAIPPADGAKPKEFTLLQNYPNPFNPSTTIRFQLEKTARVKLIIYDISAKQVQTLLDEIKPAGAHEVRFEAGKLPSGFYFYTLVADGFTDTKQMVLLK